LPSALRDKFGETFGSGSGIAVDPKSWTRTPAGYQGTFYMLPDRGFNGSGTTDYRARINKLSITFEPLDDPQAVPLAQRQASVVATLVDTIPLTDAAGEPLTGLDPNGIRLAANGLPDLPQAPNGLISIDTESMVLLPDGSFFIGDDGPYSSAFADRTPAHRSGRRNFRSQTPRQRSLLLGQSRSGRAGAGPAHARDRSPEQSGFRRADVDAGRQIPGRRIAERDAAGRRHLGANAAIRPAALLRHRRSRSS
jgi:hypothetical protein